MDKKLVDDLTKSIDKLTKAIEKANGCAVLKYPRGLCIFTCVCCCIQIIIAIILAVCVGYSLYNNSIPPIDMKSSIVICGITLFLCIGAIVCLICILKMHRYSLLTTAYNDTIGRINSDSAKDNEKMKHTAAVYQHYCQSLTKK